MKKPNRSILLASALLLIAVGLTVYALSPPTADSEPVVMKRCRLLFGPDGKTEVIIDVAGDQLMLRAPDGEPQEFTLTDNRLSDITINIPDEEGTANYTITSISRFQDEEPTPRESLMVHTTIEDGSTSYKQYCDVELREPSQPLALAHFHGPLTISAETLNWEMPDSVRLFKREKPTELRVLVGTLDKEQGCWTVVVTHRGLEESAFPEGVFPYVDIEFPPKSPDGPTIQQRYALDQFC